MIKRFVAWIRAKLPWGRAFSVRNDASADCTIIGRSEHGISRSKIPESALDVLYDLRRAGFDAWLVGGCVRDLLLGLEPKDFDITTNARPEQIKRVFKRARIIGKRFKIVHVFSRGEILEVSTYRADEGKSQHRQMNDKGRLERDNLYGQSLEEDVFRRDFTVNALYYGIKDFAIRDYCAGYEDLKAGLVRMIGDPQVRYREDPVRMLRSVRFAVKLGFQIEAQTQAPIRALAPLLEDISHARLYDEVLKLFHSGQALQTFEKLRHFGLFGVLFPQTEACLYTQEEGFPKHILTQVLASTDARIQAGKTVNSAFLFAGLLWEPMMKMHVSLMQQGMKPDVATRVAAEEVIGRQTKRVMLPRHISEQVIGIWSMQNQLARPSEKRGIRLVAEPKFRAAYDFLCLRAEVSGDKALKNTADFWTQYQFRPEVIEAVSQMRSALGDGEETDSDSARESAPRRRRPRRAHPSRRRPTHG
jgi:poly(A) polymerase